MKRILKACILAMTVLTILLSAALGEPIISDREKAVRLADKALEEKYGITQLTQEYFDRITEEKGSGYIVRYTGSDIWGYVLGTYEITVENGAVTGITWNHDGEDITGGLNAEAWGNEQILEMLLLNQETGDISLFADRLDDINEKHGFAVNRDAVNEATMVQRETKSEEAMAQAVLSVEEINQIAIQAVAELYELTDEQAAHMTVLSEPDEQAYWYIMLHNAPCLISCIGVGNGEAEPDVLPNGLMYTEKNGTYWVCVNVQTDVVEEIFYTAGIGGNG